MIGNAIFAQLTAASAVTALCAQRIFPGYIREDDQLYPQIAYHFPSNAEDQCFDGNGGISMAEATITVVGKTYADSDALSQAVLHALDEGQGTWGTTSVLGCWLNDVSEEVVHDAATEQILYFVKEMQFSVSYRTT